MGDWTDPKKLKEIAKELQRQLQRKEADALRLTDRVQKLISLRDEQLAESQAERRRLHYALEQEEVEVQIVMIVIRKVLCDDWFMSMHFLRCLMLGAHTA